MIKKRLLIIDYDTALYITALRAQGNTFQQDEDFTPEIDYENMTSELANDIKQLMYDTKCTAYRAYVTGKENFRYKFLPSYKWRRKDTLKPIALDYLKDWALKNLNVICVDGEEADDSCCRDFTTEEEGIHKVLCHVDKDLKQVKGEHYNPNSQESFIVSEEEADIYLWRQVIEGDATDCYAGCPNVGESKSTDIILKKYATRPYYHHFTRGAKAGTFEVRWENYYDSKLTIPQAILTWYLRGYYTKGGMSTLRDSSTTSGFKEDIKITLMTVDGKPKFHSNDILFVKNEIKTQYTIARMLRAGESIPKELYKIDFN